MIADDTVWHKITREINIFMAVEFFILNISRPARERSKRRSRHDSLDSAADLQADGSCSIGMYR